MFAQLKSRLHIKREERCPICGEVVPGGRGVQRYGKRFCHSWHADFYHPPPPWWRRLRWPADEGGGGLRDAAASLCLGRKMTLSVLVAGPALLREGLCALLGQEEDFAVGTEANAIFSARSPPDVIICCADTPGALRDLQARWPQARVLVVADLSPATAGRLIDLGAIGLFPLAAEPDELIWAIRSVAQGRLTLHPSVLRALVAHLAEADYASPLSLTVSLTARERDVLRCLVLGASDKDIAQQLYLSVRTVQSHLIHLYRKLGVRSRTEAALIAVRAGWFVEEATRGMDEFSNSTETDSRHSALVPTRSE